jgi:hypothetical protein
LAAGETIEDVNHSDIAKHKMLLLRFMCMGIRHPVMFDRVDLRYKVQACITGGAIRYFAALDKGGITPQFRAQT